MAAITGIPNDESWVPGDPLSRLEAMQRVAESGALPIDLVVYPDVLEVDDVGPVVADHLQQFFDSSSSMAVVAALRAHS